MIYNNQDINNIKNDIKSIKLMFLGLLIITPIYYTSIYFLSKQACKNAFLTVAEYINVVEKNTDSNEIDSNSDGHELDASIYNNIPNVCNPIKRGLFNFY